MNQAKWEKVLAQALPYWRKHAEMPEALKKSRTILARYARNDRLAHCRLSVDRQTVETSKGAQVPVAEVPDLWRSIQLVRRSGEVFTPNGHTIAIGSFHVDRIDINGDMKVGCHFIPYSEAEYIAKELSL